MDNQDKIVKLLEELIFWIKEMASPQIKQRLDKTLDTSEQKIAYDISDGIKTTREVGKFVKVSHVTIGNWWKSWINEGIAEAIPVKGGGSRAKKKFSLENFGIEISK